MRQITKDEFMDYVEEGFYLLNKYILEPAYFLVLVPFAMAGWIRTKLS